MAALPGSAQAAAGAATSFRRSLAGSNSGSALTVTGWAEEDGTVEVVEDPGHRFALGVLWHPEVGDDPRLFDALVTAAADPAGSRRSTA